MPAKKKTNKQILAELDKQFGKDWADNADKKPEVSGGLLPGGVTGIAQYVGYDIGQVADGKNNEGAPKLTIKGSVRQPAEFANFYCGKTAILVNSKPFNGKPGKTAKKKFMDFQEDMKLVGINCEGTSVKDVEAALQAHVSTGQHFRFSTFAFDETPDRVFIKFHGVCDYDSEEEEAMTSAEDEGLDEPEEDEEVVFEEEEEAEEDTDDVEEEEEEEEAEISIQDHGAFADEDDAESQQHLTELASEHNIDPNEYETWVEVADAIVAAQSKPKRRTRKKKAAAK